MSTDAAATQPSAREFVISRTLDAPRELVFEAWTNPKHIKQWWGPRAFPTARCEMEVRVGGEFLIVMRGPDGKDYPIKGVFREVVPPSKLVMAMDLSDHPDEWKDLIFPNRDKNDPDPVGEFRQTITFEEAGAGKTKLTVRALMKSSEVRDAMVKTGMNEGWSETLDRLSELLPKIKK